MEPEEFFSTPHSIAQKQYEALRMYFVEKKSAQETAEVFGYQYRGFTTVIENFRKQLHDDSTPLPFFQELKRGPKNTKKESDIVNDVVLLRKRYYSVEDIKIILDSKGVSVSEKTIFTILKNHGFSRLPRRHKFVKEQKGTISLKADKSRALEFTQETFKSGTAGVLCLLPYLEKFGIIEAIEKSSYPETKSFNKVNSLLSFIALKVSNVRRYTADNLWCMDRGLGLFAGLNVLPKASWFTSYSHRVTTSMNKSFLQSLHTVWNKNGLLSDTINLDFTTIPYWGEHEHLENNWSGKRGKALASMLAVLAHDSDSGIIDYGDTNILHKNEHAVVLEFLDFYRKDNSNSSLKYLVFDSKFTTYENLNSLNEKGIRFVTIRKRGKSIVDELNKLPKEQWKTVRVDAAGNKKRTLKVNESYVSLKGYEGKVRQVALTGHGKAKPALIITNDTDLSTEKIVRKYSQRWIVEKAISEQIEFFHLNRVSSSVVIKVDFDLTMSILAHNIYRLFAQDLERYEKCTAQTLYEKCICNEADVSINKDVIEVKLKKKRMLPTVLDAMEHFNCKNYKSHGNKRIIFSGASYS